MRASICRTLAFAMLIAAAAFAPPARARAQSEVVPPAAQPQRRVIRMRPESSRTPAAPSTPDAPAAQPQAPRPRSTPEQRWSTPSGPPARSHLRPVIQMPIEGQPPVPPSAGPPGRVDLSSDGSPPVEHRTIRPRTNDKVAGPVTFEILLDVAYPKRPEKPGCDLTARVQLTRIRTPEGAPVDQRYVVWASRIRVAPGGEAHVLLTNEEAPTRVEPGTYSLDFRVCYTASAPAWYPEGDMISGDWRTFEVLPTPQPAAPDSGEL